MKKGLSTLFFILTVAFLIALYTCAVYRDGYRNGYHDGALEVLSALAPTVTTNTFEIVTVVTNGVLEVEL
mgnify:CR=1 FL=1